MTYGGRRHGKGLFARVRGVLGAAALLCVGLTGGAYAQEPVAPQPIDPFAADQIVDFREQMRNLIQSIATYGRTLNPNFVVIAKGGLALVGKPDPLDPERVFPASAFGRAIDGVMESTLLDETVTTPDGKLDPRLEEELALRQADLARAKDMQLTIFDLEYDSAPAAIDTKYAQAASKGYVPFVAPAEDLSKMPAHPKSAFNANPGFVTATKAVKNYIYLANSQAFGSTDDYVRAIRNTNYDMVVVDVFSGGAPLTTQQVDLLKYKRLGSRRLVLAQIDIGSAAAFQYFWQPGWGPGNPPFIYAPIRTDPDRNHVIYWDAGWHAVLYGSANSYVYGVAALGFDGVVLTGVERWRFYEGGGDQQ